MAHFSSEILLEGVDVFEMEMGFGVAFFAEEVRVVFGVGGINGSTLALIGVDLILMDKCFEIAIDGGNS